MTENKNAGATRRTVVKGAAWSIPVIAAAVATPIAAASDTTPTNSPYGWYWGNLQLGQLYAPYQLNIDAPNQGQLNPPAMITYTLKAELASDANFTQMLAEESFPFVFTYNSNGQTSTQLQWAPKVGYTGNAWVRWTVTSAVDQDGRPVGQASHDWQGNPTVKQGYIQL